MIFTALDGTGHMYPNFVHFFSGSLMCMCWETCVRWMHSFCSFGEGTEALSQNKLKNRKMSKMSSYDFKGVNVVLKDLNPLN